MVAMVRLEGQLFLGFATGLLEPVALGGVNDIGGGGGVNAVSLDGDDELASVLQEHVGIQSNNTGLIGLGNIREDDVHHADQHAVTQRLTGIFDDRDDVRSLLGHVGQITAGTVRELDGVNNAFRANHVGNMGDGGSGSATEVQNTHAGLDGHVANATNDGSGDLGSERIPDTVLDLFLILFDGDSLLAVDGFADNQILSDEGIILALGDEAAFVTVGLDDDLGPRSLAFAALAFALAFAEALAAALAFSETAFAHGFIVGLFCFTCFCFVLVFYD